MIVYGTRTGSGGRTAEDIAGFLEAPGVYNTRDIYGIRDWTVEAVVKSGLLGKLQVCAQADISLPFFLRWLLGIDQ